jgi:CheY-like chemotaxis protein
MSQASPKPVAAPDSRPHVLIVDDVKANLILLDALLEDMGCTVIAANSGNEALRLLLKH